MPYFSFDEESKLVYRDENVLKQKEVNKKLDKLESAINVIDEFIRCNLYELDKFTSSDWVDVRSNITDLVTRKSFEGKIEKIVEGIDI